MAQIIAAKVSESANEIDSLTRVLVNRSTKLKSNMAAGNTPFDVLIQQMELIDKTKKRIDDLKIADGLNEYYQAQFDNPGYDAVAEIDAMLVTAVTMATNIIDAVPESAAGYAEVVTIGEAGNPAAIVWRTLTPAQTSGFRDDIDAFLLTVTLA